MERHNAVIKKTLDKLHIDETFAELDGDILLSHAIRAKNSLLNRFGYSPFQLVFGRDNRLNPVEDNNHSTSNANQMKKMVEALFEARVKILEAENELRIKTSLEHQSNRKYDKPKNGDIVSYYRNGIKSEKGWKGPAKVIGIDNNTVIMGHRPQLIHAHKREVRKFRKGAAGERAWEEMIKDKQQKMTNNETNGEKKNNEVIFVKKSKKEAENEIINQQGTLSNMHSQNQRNSKNRQQNFVEMALNNWFSQQAHKVSN